MATQFVSDVIIVAFEANCSLKPKHTFIKILMEFSEHKLEVKSCLIEQRDKKQLQTERTFRNP